MRKTRVGKKQRELVGFLVVVLVLLVGGSVLLGGEGGAGVAGGEILDRDGGNPPTHKASERRGTNIEREKDLEEVESKVSDVASGKQMVVTGDEARGIVSELGEVVEYLERVPKGQVRVDRFDRIRGVWVIQVVEYKDGHSATFNWYEVDVESGETKSLF